MDRDANAGTEMDTATVPSPAGLTAAAGDSSDGETDPSSSDSESQDDDTSIDEDDMFDLLSNRRRRYTLHALTRADGRMELGPLAEQVAAWENETSVDEVTSTQRKRVYTALQQSHLPRMDDMGALKFDKRAGEVEPTEEISKFNVYMDVVQSSDIPWSEYYLALSGVSAAILAGVWVQAPVFSWLPPLAWSALVVGLFGISAIVHLHHTRSRRVGGGTSPPEVDS
jgi:hypothetical protein